MEKYKLLQNGSDIRGVALEGIEGENVNFTKQESFNITISFLNFLSKKLNKDIKSLVLTVGNDSRLSASNIKDGIISAAIHIGATIIDCSLSSTPSMFMSTKFDETNADGAIMVTASHLPFNRNGMKFFTKDGGLDKSDIKKIVNINKEIKFIHYDSNKTFNLLDKYSNYICDIIKNNVTPYKEKPLKGFKIIVDAGNGAGGFFADKVLKQLGANITGSQFLDPDGTFPNHIPNPEDKEAMASITKATIDSNADLGIIFDTDVDRAAIVDKNGNAINRNKLIALMSAITLKEYPNTTIVTDSVTSDELTTFIESIGGKHLRYKRGYKNVINKSIELNSNEIHSSLAMETSGHGAFKENFFLDDGAYTVTKILIEASKLKNENKDISDLISNFKETEYTKEIRIKINTDNFLEYGNTVLKDFEKLISNDSNFTLVTPNYEGIRVNFNFNNNTGWILMRMSLHDPVIPINIESSSSEGLNKAISYLNEFLTNYNKLI